MSVDKLDTIVTALAQTGNAIAVTEDDGSDEWNVGSLSYEAAIKYLLGSHDWKFATEIRTLTRTGDSDDDDYEDAYAKPSGTLGLIWVKVGGYPIDWKIVGNQVLVNADENVKAKVVIEPDPEEMPMMFVEALRCLVKAGLYEGLNEDTDEARRQRSEAEAKLALARSRSDREDAPRRMFRSRILARRRGEVLS